MPSLLHVSKDFIFVLITVAEQWFWLNCSLSWEEIWNKSLKKFPNDPELLFFLSRLKAGEIKDEWGCWGEQKATVMFPFCVQKSQIFGVLLQKWGGEMVMSPYSSRTNGNLSCNSYIENNWSVNKALLNEILISCPTLAFIWKCWLTSLFSVSLGVSWKEITCLNHF